MKNVLSGIRATGRLHLGNYFGAVRHFVNFQSNPDYFCLYFIADYHTLTTLDNPEAMRGNVLDIAKDYLAAGLDPSKSKIYVQSSIPEFTELSLLLSMGQSIKQLQTLPSLQDLLKGGCEPTLGMLTYPVLMAADILGTRSKLVPVGKDQVSNLELARDLAKSFNKRYGETFILPEAMKEMVKVPGLKGNKMGKSDGQAAVDISAPIETIRKMYAKHALTDTKRTHRDIPGNPDDCPAVYPMHLIVSPKEKETQEIAHLCSTAGIGCGDCKNRLVDRLGEILGPFQAARKELEGKDKMVREILHEGGKSVRETVREVTAEVREKMGVQIY